MASYEELGNLMNNGIFMMRAEVAIAHVAYQIRNEPDTTENYANRQIWCVSAIDGITAPREMLRRMFWDIVGNQDIKDNKENSTDTQIHDAISAVVNDFATGA